MSKDRQRALRAVEKFRKNAAKELERARALQDKSKRLTSLKDTTPAIAQFFDRLQQKALQASGELVWADQLVDQIRVSMAPPPKPDKKRKATAAASAA